MMRMSTPLSRRWMAKLCRRTCTLARLSSPAAAADERRAACKTGSVRQAASASGSSPLKCPELGYGLAFGAKIDMVRAAAIRRAHYRGRREALNSEDET